MLVTDLSVRTGASARSVRHYDRAGLLSSDRASNGYREFPDVAVDEVRQIRRLIQAGLSLADIKTLRPCLSVDGEFNGCDLARSLLAEHIGRLQQRIAADKRTLDLLRERQEMMTQPE